MGGIRYGVPRKTLNRGKFRRIPLGIRKVTRPGSSGKPNYTRNILFMLVFSIAAILAIKSVSTHATFAVVVDGATVGVIEEKSVLDDILAKLCENEAMRLGAEVVVTNEVTVEPNKDKTLSPMTSDELAEALGEVVSLKAKGHVITVNGEEIVALATEEEAHGVVSDLRAAYIQAIMSSENAEIEDVFIREEVGIVEKEVTSDKFRTREEAVRILSRGTDKILNYTVRRGDSLWAIAQANHLTVDDLLKANPEVRDGNFIREGQNLNLVVADPYVTVASKELVTYTVSIPYSVDVSYDPEMWPWQEKVTVAGSSGKKEVVQEIARENGQEVSRKTISEKVLSYPVTRKIVRGSKQVPEMGSGEMAWPVQGSISSYYGWRWGSLHQGVDIAASTGTKIIAADAGMVSFAGWNGGYGNLVKIDHGGGKETYYGHMSKIAVKVGDTVAKGDVIGYVGSTGNSTGPHLHFEVREGGTAKNPLNYYK